MQDRILAANCFVCPEMCTKRNNTEAENGCQLGEPDRSCSEPSLQTLVAPKPVSCRVAS
jgi:hypothetical protein